MKTTIISLYYRISSWIYRKDFAHIYLNKNKQLEIIATK